MCLQARSSHVARVAHAPPQRGLFFFFWLTRFLIAHATNTKTQMKKNEPSGLLFTAKSGLEVTPLCREATRCKSVLPLRFAKTGPLFHVAAFWSRFKKFCFHSKNKLCAFPIFGLSWVKRRPTHVFIILTSRSFRTNSPFALSSQCRRLNL